MANDETDGRIMLNEQEHVAAVCDPSGIRENPVSCWISGLDMFPAVHDNAV